MAGRRITIDEKIERQKEVVSRIKDKYDAALDELEKLMQKREELRRKELMDAFVKSDRTYDEIMEFLKSNKKEL
jgi:hypothetical protein